MSYLRSRVLLAVAAGVVLLALVPSAPAHAAPADFTEIQNVPWMTFTPVQGGTDTLKVDVFVPNTPPPPGGYPTVVAVHGAWETSDKSTSDFEAETFADQGYLAFAPDYRLTCSPRNPPPHIDPGLCGFYYPYQPNDVAAFLNWVRDPAQVATYQGNPDDLGLFGTSGGATLVTLLETAPATYGLTALPQAAAEISAQVQLYNYTESPKAESTGARDITWMQCTYGQGNQACDAQWHQASSDDQATAAVPPTYMANGKYEIIPTPPAEDMAAKLLGFGVPSYLRIVPGNAHGSNAEPVIVAGCCITEMDEAVNYENTYLMPNPTADLSVTGTTTPADNVSLGTPLTYTLTVVNNGPNFATGATLTDPLPAGMTLTSATTTQGTCSGATTVTCTFGDLPPQTPETVTIQATPSAVGFYPNTATVSLAKGPSVDPVGSDDSVELDRSAVAQVTTNLTLKTVPSAPTMVANSNLTYTVSVRNKGQSSVDTVNLTDTLPPGVPLTSVTPSQGTCSGTATLLCQFGTLAKGQMASATIVVTPAVFGTIVNNASVTSNAVETNPSDNSATTSTKVTKAPGFVYAAIADTTYAPKTLKVGLGQSVQWYLLPQGPGPGPGTGVDTWGHTATESDDFPAPLFDSTILDPSGTFAYAFTAAGGYTIEDDITFDTQTVQVGMTASPPQGALTSDYLITWATQSAPSGLVYDVQIRKPGGQWTNWLTGVTDPNAMFTPAIGDPTGTYSFKARMRSASGNGAIRYSPVISINVT